MSCTHVFPLVLLKTVVHSIAAKLEGLSNTSVFMMVLRAPRVQQEELRSEHCLDDLLRVNQAVTWKQPLHKGESTYVLPDLLTGL